MTSIEKDILDEFKSNKPYSYKWSGPIGMFRGSFYSIFFEYDDSMTWKNAITFVTWKKDADEMCGRLNGAFLMGMLKAVNIVKK